MNDDHMVRVAGVYMYSLYIWGSLPSKKKKKNTSTRPCVLLHTLTFFMNDSRMVRVASVYVFFLYVCVVVPPPHGGARILHICMYVCLNDDRIARVADVVYVCISYYTYTASMYVCMYVHEASATRACVYMYTILHVYSEYVCMYVCVHTCHLQRGPYMYSLYTCNMIYLCGSSTSSRRRSNSA